MKLKHRGTGNWGEPLSTSGHNIMVREYAYHFGEKPYVDHHYDSLEKLNTEWEDVPEEPKKYWFIDAYGNIVQNEVTEHYGDECTGMIDAYENQKQIGNNFVTEKEAEKAVEKSKAMTKLNEFGFRFIDWELDMKTVADGKIWFDIGVNTEWDAERLLELKPEIKESLDILFGGEE